MQEKAAKNHDVGWSRRFGRAAGVAASPSRRRFLSRRQPRGVGASCSSWLGAGGYDPGHVSRRVTKTLSRDQWQTVIARLEGVQFWKMQTKSDDLPGRDGAQWIVEARRDGRYHIVDRWTGTDHGPESVGRHFLDLAGLGD